MTFNFCSLLELAIVGFMTKEPASNGNLQSGSRLRASFDTPRRSLQSRMMSFDNASTALLMTGRKLCRHYYPNECQFEESDNHFRTPKVPSNAHRQQSQMQQTVEESIPSCSYQLYPNGLDQRRKSETYITACRNCLTFKTSAWTADRIDKASCLAFPALFSLFNVAYWSYYTQP